VRRLTQPNTPVTERCQTGGCLLPADSRALVVATVLAGCGGNTVTSRASTSDHASSITKNPTSPTQPERSRALHRRVVVTDLTSPWGLAFLPAGKALVSERDPGNIVVVRPDGGKRLVKHVKGVHSNGAQGGEAGCSGWRFLRTPQTTTGCTRT
jgi:glucose/arabinose dehydrogenase